MNTTVLLQLALQPRDLVLHVAADQRVERGERLVEQQDLGVVGQGPGQTDPLLHAAAELVGVAVAEAAQTDEVEHVVPAAAGARPSPCPAPRDRTRRCRARGGGGAGRSAGTPCSSACGAAPGATPGGQPSMSSPSMSTWPAVGSMSRLRQRTSVDLPEPDRPITTKTLAFGHVEADVAHGQHVAAPGQLGPGQVGAADPTTRSRFGPNTFHTPRHRGSSVPFAHLRPPSPVLARLPRSVRRPPGPRDRPLQPCAQSCIAQAAGAPSAVAGGARRRRPGTISCRSPITA